MAAATKLSARTILMPHKVKDDKKFHSNKLLVTHVFPFLDTNSLVAINFVCRAWRRYQMANGALIQMLRDRSWTAAQIRTLQGNSYNAQEVPALYFTPVEDVLVVSLISAPRGQGAIIATFGPGIRYPRLAPTDE